MVIIITGSSHVGKTILAQRMLEKYKYPYLSIDHLKMGLIRSGNTALTPEDDEALTAYLWPIVREIIKTAVENGQNLIVEGCYVPTGWRKDFDERYLPFIRCICLAMTEAYIDAHFGEILAHESEIETRLIEADFTADGLKKDNRRFIDEFIHAGEKVYLIHDFERMLKALTEEDFEAGEGRTDMTTVEILGANRFETYTKTRTASRAVIVQDGKILLVHEVNSGLWLIPGGGMEEGETPAECCVREAEEETGRIVRPAHPFTTLREYYEEYCYITHYFACKVTGMGQLHLTPGEIRRGATPEWLPLQEAVEMFSRHQSYAEVSEEKRGIYLREYTALLEYLKTQPQDGSLS